MSEDEKNGQDKKPSNPADHLRLHKAEATEKAVAQLEAHREAKKISNPNSNWTLAQEILQEIMAGHTVINPDRLPPLTQMVEELKKEIEIRYADDAETKDILLKSIPAMRSVREWVKKDGWDVAVWGYIRADGLFTANKRAEVIESLRKRALDKSDVAAKIWLTLSGDYSEKMEVDNKSVDVYREINSILHGNKKKNEA
jgi:hypothetical protein